ncbi:SDR family oxidoreductase [Gordonia crocea]|uniref:Short-chain dehydrogenase n=1 Tax=Gordonia crocea TaxID=589162 RepID=A0A7M3SUA9_9ACTN|nr:short-chain dehydrogenase [Gordonia crocea]
MVKQQRVAGSVIAITGGGRGIGAAIAARAAAQGGVVALGDRDREAAVQTAAELGGRARGYSLDVTDEESFAAFLSAVETDLGPIDVLVNNAGVMWVGAFDAEPPSSSEAMVAVNLLGVIRGVRLAAPAMRRRGRGQIVTVASAASKLAPPGEATYAATKHGVLGYLTAVREELRGTGVTISAILPGVVDTQLAAGTDTGAASMLSPDEVADAVVGVIGRPRFAVTVPGYIGPLVALTGLLPQRIRDAVLRRTVPDQVAAVKQSNARAGYEEQALRRDRDE